MVPNSGASGSTFVIWLLTNTLTICRLPFSFLNPKEEGTSSCGRSLNLFKFLHYDNDENKHRKNHKNKRYIKKSQEKTGIQTEEKKTKTS